jgi:hypothetical protein
MKNGINNEEAKYEHADNDTGKKRESSWLLQSRAPKRRDSRLDCPRRNPGATAEVSGVSCRLSGDGNRNQYFCCGGRESATVPRCRVRYLARSCWETTHSQPEGRSMNHVNAIALNLISLGLGSLRGLSLGDVALIIAWTLILIVYVAGQGLRFPRKRRSKN